MTVHGRAAAVDVRSADHAVLRQTLLDVYVRSQHTGRQLMSDCAAAKLS